MADQPFRALDKGVLYFDPENHQGCWRSRPQRCGRLIKIGLDPFSVHLKSLEVLFRSHQGEWIVGSTNWASSLNRDIKFWQLNPSAAAEWLIKNNHDVPQLLKDELDQRRAPKGDFPPLDPAVPPASRGPDVQVSPPAADDGPASQQFHRDDIPVDRRSRIMTLTKAGSIYLGKDPSRMTPEERKATSREFRRDYIKTGMLKAYEHTKKRWHFDIEGFPASVRDRVRPTQG